MPSSTTMVAVPGHLLGREQKNRRSPTDRRPHNAIMAHVHHSRPQRPGHTQNNLPGSRNTVVQRHLSGPTARKWSKRTGRVTTCETPSHHARRPAGAGRRNHPGRPARRPHRAQHPPAHPEETRMGHRGRPPHPTAQQSSALRPANASRRPRTTSQTRKIRPSRSPRPSCSASSKPSFE